MKEPSKGINWIFSFMQDNKLEKSHDFAIAIIILNFLDTLPLLFVVK
jgi:hypothetical protein